MLAKSLFLPQSYGKIVFSFGQMMDERNITRNKLATLAGFHFDVADRLYKGELERVDMDVLAKFCCVLDCDVSDVMKFEKP